MSKCRYALPALLVAMLLACGTEPLLPASRAAAADKSDPKAAIRELQKQRDVLQQEREPLIARINLGNLPEAEIRALAAQQKEDLEKARDEYRAAQQSALNSMLSGAWANALAGEKRRASAKLQKQAQARREMILKNNQTIAENQRVIGAAEKELSNYAGNATLQAWRKTMENAPEDQKKTMQADIGRDDARMALLKRELDRAQSQNKTLLRRNEAASRVVTAIATAEGNPTPATLLKKYAELQDALLQEKNTWDKTLSDPQKDNDWARRVTAEMFLGVDPAILQSMNAEMTLIHMSPTLKESFMRRRAEMFDEMAKGVDQSLEILLRQARAAKAALPDVEQQRKALDERIDALDQQVADYRAGIILDLLPKVPVNEGVLERWMQSSPTIVGFECDNRLTQAVVKEFLQRRQQRIDRLAAMFSDLVGRELTLVATPPSPVTWNGEAGKMEITVEVEDRGFSRAIEEMRDLARRLTGLAPTVTVTDRWTFLDKHTFTNWPETSEHRFVFETPQTHFVQVRRAVKLKVDAPPRHMCPAAVLAAVNKTAELGVGRIKIEFAEPPPVRRFVGPTNSLGDGAIVLTICQQRVEATFDSAKKNAAPPEMKSTTGDRGAEALGHNAVAVLDSVLSSFSRAGRWRGTFDPATGQVKGTLTHRTAWGGKPNTLPPRTGTFSGTLQGNQLLGKYTETDPASNESWTTDFKLLEQPAAVPQAK